MALVGDPAGGDFVRAGGMVCVQKVAQKQA